MRENVRWIDEDVRRLWRRLNFVFLWNDEVARCFVTLHVMAYQEQLDREKHVQFVRASEDGREGAVRGGRDEADARRHHHETQVRDMDEAESNVQKIYSKLLDTPVEKIDVGDTLAGYMVEGKKTILWTEQAPQRLAFHSSDEKQTPEEEVQDHAKT